MSSAFSSFCFLFLGNDREKKTSSLNIKVLPRRERERERTHTPRGAELERGPELNYERARRVCVIIQSCVYRCIGICCQENLLLLVDM